MDYRLPKPEASLYCSHLFSYFGIDQIVLKRKQNGQDKLDIKDELNMLKALLESLMTASGMSLREQEQTVARLKIVLQTIPLDKHLYPVALSTLLFLREWNPKTYASLLDEKIYIEEFLDWIDKLPYSQQASKLFNVNFSINYRDIIEALLICGVQDEDVTLTKKDLDESLSASERHEQIKSNSNPTIRGLIETLDKINQGQKIINGRFVLNSGSGLKVTRDRLEIAYQFVSQEES